MTVQKRRAHGQTLSYYELGATPFFACQYDQRFSYCLYIPEAYREDEERAYPLAVLIHGTSRTAQGYRDAFIDFAEARACIVLAPLFPAGIIEAGELTNYKRIKFHDIRFDQVLLAMVDEVGLKYRLRGETFLLHGFSGGGQFVHRFFYLHPHRLMGLSIGAPGNVTLIDATKDWWLGTRDFKQQFGTPLPLEGMRRVPVQMVIGEEDKETWEINNRNSPHWIEGADATGTTRLERLNTLRENYEGVGIAAAFDTVPGVGHEGFRLLGLVKSFFAKVLETHG